MHLAQVCNGQGEEECTLVHQASCSTTYRRAAGGGVRGQIRSTKHTVVVTVLKLN